ncbi:PAS domain S-box protein [Paenibacillus hodogayensis]|uniref:histidine kinase n=1 Tax=Paenibacillus hodogayensis TaxID=279208 RepID=A0ABV5VYU7_9BACL
MSLERGPSDSIFFQLAFAQAPTAMAIVGVDGTVLHANDFACSFLGYAAEELTGASCFRFAHPEDAVALEKALAGMLAGDRYGGEFEKRYIHKQGHTVWASTRVSLVRDESGEPMYLMAHLIDRTAHKGAEREMRLILKRYEALFHNHPDLIYSLNLDGTYTYANRTFLDTFALEAEQIESGSLHLRMLVAPDQLAAAEERFRQVKGGESQRHEFVGIDSRGRRIVFDVANSPIEVDGRVIGVHGVARDITKLKKLWDRLEQSQSMYELISLNSQDIISYSALDGTILYMSPASHKLLGFAPEEMLGKSFAALWHPVDLEAASCQLLPGTDSHKYTYRVKHKAGHYVWIETMAKLISDAAGRPDKILAVSRDISDRKRAEDELKAAKERLESSIAHNIDPIMVYDSDNRIIQVNEAFEQAFGWKADELLTRSIYDIAFVPPELNGELERNLIQLNGGQPVLTYETQRQRKDGRSLPVSLTAFPLRDGQGNVSGCSVSFRDMTDRKQSEERMVNAEKLSIAGQLAAGIAHEIRNPITAIKGFIQLMNGGGFSQKREYFDIIASEIARIEMILNELLVLAKPQSVLFRPKDIGLLLHQVKTLLDSQAIMNNVQLVTDFEPDSVVISCDENQLKQVWINVIKNGIEAMPGGGLIVIQLRQRDDFAVVTISDEGCGIPGSQLARLGEPFYTTKEKGNGLGFMVSKRIIENHGGTLGVSSREGEGTSVEVRLPFEQPG